MSNRYYEIKVFGIDYRLVARDSRDSYLTFYLEDNSKFPNFEKWDVGKLTFDIKMPDGINRRTLLTRSAMCMFMARFI